MSSEGDKTEEATPHRLEEARRKGQIAFSRDMGGGVVLLAVYGAMAIGASTWLGELAAYLRTALASASAATSPTVALGLALHATLRASLVVVLPAVAAAVLVGALQTNFLLSFEAVRFDPERLAPSLKRVVSGASLVEMAKGLIKVTLVGAVAWVTVAGLGRVLGNLAGAAPARVLAVTGAVAKTLGFRLAMVALALGIADLLWQRWKHQKSLRMTRDEVKREYKESEGDPHHKAERGRLHRELMEQRMVADVRKADFVIVNPDHIAIALRYDRDRDGAPVVVAKGERLLAEKIKEVAREAGVPIFRDVTLARSLRDVTEGDEIPEALYEAVAEIVRVLASLPGAPAAPAPVTPPAGPAAPSDANDPTRGSHWRRA